MRATLTLLLSLLGATVAGMEAQEDPRVAVLEAVVAARADQLGDTTRLSRCSLQSALSIPISALDAKPGIHAAVEPGPVTCGPDGPRPTAFTRTVSVDSVRVTDSAAVVHLSVQRGEMVRNERYVLTQGGASSWIVEQVTLSGMARSYFRRPRPASP